MATITNPPSLVTSHWLKQALSSPNHKLALLDCSWYMPSAKHPVHQDFEEFHLAGAQYFDIDKISDTSSNLPHMLPTAEYFAQKVSELGISNDSHVICYDMNGQYIASARAWWMFKVFGHDKVSVLSRGIVKDDWKDSPSLIETGPATHTKKNNSFKVTETRHHLVANMPQIISNISKKEFQVVDARSADRFYGRVAEPRPALQRGHIPNAHSVPFQQVLDNREIVAADKLKQVFIGAGIDLSKPIVTSCGSGVTAGILTLSLSTLGINSSVYDGSWSEYAQESINNPVDK